MNGDSKSANGSDGSASEATTDTQQTESSQGGREIIPEAGDTPTSEKDE